MGACRAAVALFAVLLSGAGIASAQETGDLMGQITVEGTDRPVVAALVTIQALGARATTDSKGRFHLHRLPPGAWTVRVESVGHEPVELQVDIGPGRTVSVTARLVLRAIELGGIDVTVLRPDLRPEGRLAQEAIRSANPRDPGELLRALPGVAAIRRGPIGLDPVVRGLRETQVGSYIDGERRFPAGPARMDSPLSHVDPLAFSSLEVVKGPYALTWGAGNLAAIRVGTRRMPIANEGPHGYVSAGYNTNLGAAETSGSLFGRAGDVSWWGFGAFRNGHDYEDGNGAEVPGDFESWEARGKISVETDDNSRVEFGGGYQDQSGPIDYPGRLLNAELFQTANVSLGWMTDLTGSEGTVRGLDFQVYYNDTDHDMTNADKPTAEPDSLRTPPYPLDIRVTTTTGLLGGRGAAILKLGGWEVEVGGDFYSANRNAIRTVRRADMDPEPLLFEDLIWPDVRISDIGLFARGDKRVSSHLHVSLAGRVDFVSASADTASQFFTDNVSDDLEASEANVSGAVTLSLGLSSNWNLNLALGSSVRPSDALERYSDRFPSSRAQLSAEFVGNPQLEPERSTQADVWFEGTYERVSLQTSLFVRSINNYITLEPTALDARLPLSPDVVFRYVNGDATFWGFDAQAAIGITDDWTLKLAADYLWGEDDLLSEPVLGIAPPKGTVGVRYQLPSRVFHGEATLQLVSEVPADRVSLRRGETATDGYAVGDIRFGWQASDKVLVRFGVENVADTYYVDHLNAKNPFTGRQIPEAGRVVYGKLSLAF
ncbi:MAG: TonB-dependent receptor [Gemmatimonadota bacterium]|nr:TonB-dependent receptor [Gemmatimonadota bacterium]